MHNVLKLFISVMMIVSIIAILNASSNGRTGATVTGCTCHGTSNTNTTVSISAQSGSFTVQTGSTTTYTVTVANGSFNYFGTNIALKTTETGNTNAGSLSASGNDLQVSGGELTHTAPKNGSGSTTFTFTWTSPTTAGTYFLRAVGNAVDNQGSSANDQWNLMTVREITVVAPTEITLTSPNGGENLCAGSSHNITWTSSSVSNVKIDLSSDGGSSFPVTLIASTPAAAGSWLWSIPGGQAVANNYKLRISDVSNSSINDISQSNFAIAPITQISGQPQSVVVCQGQPAQFSITAAGAGLGYKWRKDGVDLPNSNSATFTINNVQPVNAGNYTCVVTGACGNPVGSNTAVLTVDALPVVTSQPLDTSLCTGGRVTFSITAAGEGISYQWRKNGAAIPNAIQTTYTIQNVQKINEGNYDCVVSGKCSPPATSQSAELFVNEAVNITKQPVSSTVCEGGDGYIFVGASGSDLVFSWIKNGTVIPNTNNDTLFFNNASVDDAGFYSVLISGACTQELNSTSVSVVVNPLAKISEHPTSLEVVEGEAANFSISAEGDNLKYQWKKDGVNITGMTNSTLTLSNVKLSDAGSYACEVVNECGNILSETAILKVNPAGNGAVLSLSNTKVEFETTKIGSTSNDILVEGVRNTGNEDLIINGVNIEGTNAEDFQISGLSFPILLKTEEAIDLNIQFTPIIAGESKAVVKFVSNAINDPTLELSGVGAVINVDSDVNVLSIVSAGIGEKGENTVEITNRSSIDIHVNLSLIGPDSNSFIIRGEEQGLLIKKDSSISVVIEYNPTSWMTIKAELQIEVVETGDLSFVGLEGDVAVSVLESGDRSKIEIFPNPANSGIKIDIRALSQQVQSIEIFNYQGILVHQFTSTNIASSGYLIWDCSDMTGQLVPSGDYRLVIRTENDISSYPILIIKN